MNLSDLPLFQVTAVRRLIPSEDGTFTFEVTGTCSRVLDLEVGSRYWMYVDGVSSPLADVTSLDEHDQVAVLEGTAFDGESVVAVGDTFPLVTSYWNAYVYAAILDESRRWYKRIFKPAAAFESDADGGGVERSTPARPGTYRIYPSQTKGGAGVRVIDAGWDHEHCEICNGHIDEANPIAHVDESDTWLCDLCYAAFAERHDIGFVANDPEWVGEDVVLLQFVGASLSSP